MSVNNICIRISRRPLFQEHLWDCLSKRQIPRLSREVPTDEEQTRMGCCTCWIVPLEFLTDSILWYLGWLDAPYCGSHEWSRDCGTFVTQSWRVCGSGRRYGSGLLVGTTHQPPVVSLQYFALWSWGIHCLNIGTSANAIANVLLKYWADECWLCASIAERFVLAVHQLFNTCHAYFMTIFRSWQRALSRYQHRLC